MHLKIMFFNNMDSTKKSSVALLAFSLAFFFIASVSPFSYISVHLNIIFCNKMDTRKPTVILTFLLAFFITASG
ncbi:hypothetical protein ACSQ67_009751 [Phaseolus vulgaris]